MKPNKATINLIKQFEGCRLDAYLDPVNIPTIGYGLTTGALSGVVVSMGMTITQRDADRYLARVLEKFGNQILVLMTRKPTPDQYGAMLSLSYNIGVGAFSRSTCLKRFNAGDMDGAADALQWFNKAGGKVLRGLVRRRTAEATLFMGGNAPTAHNGPVDEPKAAHKSSTLGAAGVAGLSMAASASDDVKEVIGNLGIEPKWILLGIGIAAVLWVARERLKKMGKYGV